MPHVEQRLINLSNKTVTLDTKTDKIASKSTKGERHFNRTITFLFNNEHVYNRTELPVEILIIIATSPVNYLLRNTLRETWLRHLLQNNVTIRYIFLLGQSNHDHDINQENCIIFALFRNYVRYTILLWISK